MNISALTRSWQRKAQLDTLPQRHSVFFYESKKKLSQKVTMLIASAIQNGEGAIIIATPEHRSLFLQDLADFDVEKALQSKQLVVLDAEETLAKFMTGDLADPTKFVEVIGGQLDELSRKYPFTHVYGEMVNVLIERNNVHGTLLLESFWNTLGRSRHFNLLCGYETVHFEKSNRDEAVVEICRCHSDVAHEV